MISSLTSAFFRAIKSFNLPRGILNSLYLKLLKLMREKFEVDLAILNLCYFLTDWIIRQLLLDKLAMFYFCPIRYDDISVYS